MGKPTTRRPAIQTSRLRCWIARSYVDCAGSRTSPGRNQVLHGVPGVHAKGGMKSWREFWITKLRRLRREGVYTYQGSINRAGQEKGVDVSIAIDLVQATHERRFESAIIISQDSDFGPAVRLALRIARSQGRTIEIDSAFPLNPAEKRQRGVPGTRWCPIERSTYDACLENARPRAK